MIAKKICNSKTKRSNGKAVRVQGLVDYIATPSHTDKREKCIHFEAVNFLTDTVAAQKLEMIALSQEAKRSADPIDH